MGEENYKRARQILADLDAVGNTTKAETKASPSLGGDRRGEPLRQLRRVIAVAARTRSPPCP